MIDLIIPTLRRQHAFQCLTRLHHVPWPVRLHLVTEGKTWAQAINIGLRQCTGTNDVVLMDDDVFISSDTLRPVDDYRNDADIFGFKLKYADGRIQHAGGIYRSGMIGHIGINEENRPAFDTPYYVCHATTSLVYVKRHVFDRIGGMAEDIPGIQCEDVDFSFRAIKQGLKILYLPSEAVHLQSASKRSLAEFSDSAVGKAWAAVFERHLQDDEFRAHVESFPKRLKPELVLA